MKQLLRALCLLFFLSVSLAVDATSYAEPHPCEGILDSDPDDVKKLRDTGVCIGCSLSMVILIELDLARADLTRSMLWNANLAKSNLSEANLTGANLLCAYLVKSNVTEANLSWVS